MDANASCHILTRKKLRTVKDRHFVMSPEFRQKGVLMTRELENDYRALLRKHGLPMPVR